MLLTRQAHVWGILGLLTLVLWFGWRTSKSSIVQTEVQAPVIEYPVEHLQWLHDLSEYGIGDVENGTTVEYAKTELEAELHEKYRPPFLQDLKLELPALQVIDSAQAFAQPIPATQKATAAALSSPPTADASHIIFGMSTLLDRLDESLGHLAHWAAGTGARFLVLIDTAPSQEEVDVVLDKAKALKINMQISKVELKFEDRYSYLMKGLFDNMDASTEWAAFIDDDTFFPSMTNLIQLLAKYDPSKPYYVGSYSEDFNQIGLWGLIAYGGAGIFVSNPLMHQIAPHFESCAAADTTGDRRVTHCVLHHTTTRLTYEPSLHQLDLRGDSSGFYEALRPQPVSVHHWKSWSKFPMAQVSLAAKICGESCIFQKYHLSNDWQMTNGISIVKYSEDRKPDDIRMERTWEDSAGQPQDEMWRHSLAPLRDRDKGKISYIMETAFYDPLNHVVRQLYVRRDRAQKHVGVIEVNWRRKGS